MRKSRELSEIQLVWSLHLSQTLCICVIADTQMYAKYFSGLGKLSLF